MQGLKSFPWTGCLWLLVVAGAAAGCQSSARSASDPQRLHPATTISELMENRIDPSADALWDSVAFIASKSHVEDRRPRTDAEWQAVRDHAVTLIEAANLLGMPGRRVKNHPAPAGPGELSMDEIQKRVEASPAGFAALAGGLVEATLRAVAAIDAKDPQALMDAGSMIDEACEACHVAYWYPGQTRP